MLHKQSNIFRLSPKNRRQLLTPHKTVYGAFSRVSSLNISIARNSDGIMVRASRLVGPEKKDKKLQFAILSMGRSPEMLRAVMADAFSHAAIKHASEQLGPGWAVRDVQVFSEPDGFNLGSVLHSGVVNLIRRV
jgi:hypothetical protein